MTSLSNIKKVLSRLSTMWGIGINKLKSFNILDESPPPKPTLKQIHDLLRSIDMIYPNHVSMIFNYSNHDNLMVQFKTVKAKDIYQDTLQSMGCNPVHRTYNSIRIYYSH